MTTLYVIKDKKSGNYYAKQGAGYGGYFYGGLNHARLYQNEQMAQATIDKGKWVRRQGQEPVVVPISLTEVDAPPATPSVHIVCKVCGHDHGGVAV